VLALYEAALLDGQISERAREQIQTQQLVSDIEAFKAANPGGIFEDFIRWYSPKDWNSEDQSLSKRMADKDNKWKKLWNAAAPVPAEKQRPLFDAFLEGEKALFYLENITLHDIISLWNCFGEEILSQQLRSISEYFMGEAGKNIRETSVKMSFPYYISLEV